MNTRETLRVLHVDKLTQHQSEKLALVESLLTLHIFTLGRCWIFSCLNVMRLPFMKKFNLEEFEFSQSYLFFWDKVRRRPAHLFSALTLHKLRGALFISCI